MRRGKGEGSIFQRKDGRWAGFVTVGYGPDGRQKKKWVYGRTRREVAEKLARLLPKAGYAVVQDPGRLRLGDWLRHWADHRAKSKGLRPATLNTYRHYLQLLEPLASTPLPRLNPLSIQALFAELAERGLSPSVRRHAYQFLKAALRDAVRAGLLERNPVEAVDPPPSGQVRPAKAWSAEEAARFLKAAEGHRLYPMLALMLATGLRIGEALALRWEDWEGERLWIRHTLRRDGTLGPTKTPRSQGYLYLDPRTQALLAEHRLAQEEEKALARRWEEHGLIFPSEVGTPLGYRSFLRTWKGLVGKAGVSYVSPHGLRHTYTSLAFRAGLSPKEVAERLRHTDPALALRVYQHLQEEDRRRAALGLDTLLHLEASD